MVDLKSFHENHENIAGYPSSSGGPRSQEASKSHRIRRVLFIVDQFPTLSETFVLDQITGLLDRGIDVQIFASSPRSESNAHSDIAANELLRRAHYTTISLREPARWLQVLARESAKGHTGVVFGFAAAMWRRATMGSDFGFPFRLLSMAEALDRLAPPDVILCHFGPNGDLGVRLRASLGLHASVVTFFHGFDVSTLVKTHGPKLYERLFREGDLFLPASKAFATVLLRLGCPAEHTKVHRMGVRFANVSADSMERVAEVDAPTELVFLCVGRLVAKKGHRETLRAFAKASARLAGQPLQLVFVGDGPLRGELESLAASLHISVCTRFLGAQSRDQVRYWLGRAHAFVLASLTGPDGDLEATPVAISEAMAMGLPILSTFHGGIPELVEDGVNGLLVQEGDVAGLADAMVALATDREGAKRMGAGGKRIVREKMDLDYWNDVLVERLEELAISRP